MRKADAVGFSLHPLSLLEICHIVVDDDVVHPVFFPVQGAFQVAAKLPLLLPQVGGQCHIEHQIHVPPAGDHTEIVEGQPRILLLQKRRVDMSTLVEEGREAAEMSNEWRFWKKEYWADFKLIKPTFNLSVLMGALSIMMLNIGANISFGGITASIAGATQNYDHLSVIDLPSTF